jgi:hypothetical protein
MIREQTGHAECDQRQRRTNGPAHKQQECSGPFDRKIECRSLKIHRVEISVADGKRQTAWARVCVGRSHRAISDNMIASTDFKFERIEERHNAKYSNQSLTDPVSAGVKVIGSSD